MSARSTSHPEREPDRAAALIERWVRPIPDWPEPGVTFRDITPLLAQPDAFASIVEAMALAGEELGPVDAVLGIEARGFIVGAPVALRLGAGFVPVRKAGKLPHDTLSVSYALEYGEATVEIHADALKGRRPRDRRRRRPGHRGQAGGRRRARRAGRSDSGRPPGGHRAARARGCSRLGDTPLRSLATF